MKNSKKDNELSIEEQVTIDCPILFQMRHRPCSETTMCWGFECNKGWHTAIASACRELEMLNIQYYPKYRVRIQADQIKEKFGTLRFYWSVQTDPNTFCTWLGHVLESAYDWLNSCKRFDYKMKKVIDVAPYDYDDKRVIDKATYDRKVNDKYKPTNVEYIESNGSYFEICHLHDHGKMHYEPTRLKLLWHLKRFCFNMRSKLLYCAPRKTNAEVRNCIELLDRKARKIVQELEAKCEGICERCGHQIGTSWSPTCQTLGWITYICDDCAEKLGQNYLKNGELWNGKTLLKSKEQMNAQHEED